MTNYQLLNQLFIRIYLSFRMSTTFNGTQLSPAALLLNISLSAL